MRMHADRNETQKPRVGLLVCLVMVVTLGAGCGDSVNAVGDSLKSTGATIQTKFEEMKATVAAWQATLAKAQAIYDILHSDDAAKIEEAPKSDGTTAEIKSPEPTPSVPPSEDPLPPEAADSTSSQ